MALAQSQLVALPDTGTLSPWQHRLRTVAKMISRSDL
jgi:hypothetical protein